MDKVKNLKVVAVDHNNTLPGLRKSISQISLLIVSNILESMNEFSPVRYSEKYKSQE